MGRSKAVDEWALNLPAWTGLATIVPWIAMMLFIAKTSTQSHKPLITAPTWYNPSSGRHLAVAIVTLSAGMGLANALFGQLLSDSTSWFLLVVPLTSILTLSLIISLVVLFVSARRRPDSVVARQSGGKPFVPDRIGLSTLVVSVALFALSAGLLMWTLVSQQPIWVFVLALAFFHLVLVGIGNRRYLTSVVTARLSG